MAKLGKPINYTPWGSLTSRCQRYHCLLVDFANSTTGVPGGPCMREHVSPFIFTMSPFCTGLTYHGKFPRWKRNKCNVSNLNGALSIPKKNNIASLKPRLHGLGRHNSNRRRAVGHVGKGLPCHVHVCNHQGRREHLICRLPQWERHFSASAGCRMRQTFAQCQPFLRYFEDSHQAGSP